MKFSLTLTLALFIANFSQAQVSFFLEAGPQQTSAKENNILPGWDTAWKPFYTHRTAFSFGLGSEIILDAKNHLFLQSSLLFSGKGRSFSQNRSESQAILTDTMAIRSKLDLNYIELPILLAYKFPLNSTVNFHVAGGIYTGFIYSGNKRDEFRIYSSKKYVKNDESIETGNDRNKYKTADWGFTAKAGIELGKFSADAFIENGLTSFYTANDVKKINHRVVGLKLAYRLGELPEVPVKNKDRDGDGIEDEIDACPLEPGFVLSSGCPDEDRDGIADKTDKCPKIKGEAKYGGCPIPDSDADGVDDEKDACPTQKGLTKFKGCPPPDKDGDGVEDESDKCPALFGPVSNAGCPLLSDTLKKKFAAVASQIFFNYKSDSLLNTSIKALDELVELMQNNPPLVLKIVGHTDNAGTPASNLVLSQKRTETVKAYFISKGIDKIRIEAIGMGQSQPISNNDTEEGRKRNRRVELIVEEKKY